MDNYHLTKDGEKWKLKPEGGGRARASGSSKAEAMENSTEYMRKHGGSMKVHKASGGFQEERTYPRKRDPKRSPG